MLESEGFTVFSLPTGYLKTELRGPGVDLTIGIGARASLDTILNATREDSSRLRNIFVKGRPLYDGQNPS